MLRWLLPFVAVLAFFGQAVTAYAATGTIGDASCCCPVQAKCKCGHDDESTPMMKRCNGDAKLVAPTPAVATLAEPLTVACEPHAVDAPVPTFEPIPDDVSREPEKPPF